VCSAFFQLNPPFAEEIPLRGKKDAADLISSKLAWISSAKADFIHDTRAREPILPQTVAFFVLLCYSRREPNP
jgi:hypothetical protein